MSIVLPSAASARPSAQPSGATAARAEVASLPGLESFAEILGRSVDPSAEIAQARDGQLLTQVRDPGAARRRPDADKADPVEASPLALAFIAVESRPVPAALAGRPAGSAVDLGACAASPTAPGAARLPQAELLPLRGGPVAATALVPEANTAVLDPDSRAAVTPAEAGVKQTQAARDPGHPVPSGDTGPIALGVTPAASVPGARAPESARAAVSDAPSAPVAPPGGTLNPPGPRPGPDPGSNPGQRFGSNPGSSASPAATAATSFSAVQPQSAPADETKPAQGDAEAASPSSGVAANVQAPAAPAASGPAAAPTASPGSVAPEVGSGAWGPALGHEVIKMKQGGQQVAQLQLNPPGLGPLQVMLTVTDQQAQVEFVSPHPAVRAAVEAALPQLRATLADNGINLGQTSVGGDSQQHPGTFSQNHAGQPAPRRHTANSASQLSSPTLREVPASGPAPARANGNTVDTFA